MTMAGPLDLVLIRHSLLSRLAELQGRVDRIEEEQARPIDDDFAEGAIEREQGEVLEGVEHEALAEIAAIREAFLRLEAGTYGRCIACDAPIPAKRMEVLPTATECIGCAQARESRKT